MIKTYIFDENNPYWEKDPNYNMMFLRCQQVYCNDYAKANNGFVPFIFVLKNLGFPFTEKDLPYVMINTNDGIDFGLSGQEPKKTGRPKRKFKLTFCVRSVLDTEDIFNETSKSD